MSREADFHLARQEMEAAKKFCDAAMVDFDAYLDKGSPEQIEQRRVIALASVEAWLDAVALVYWRSFEAQGIDPDKRHLWKRSAR